MNRGSIDRSARVSPPSSGFNEAPIHESGKCSSESSIRPVHERFNEAPIHESGKCPMSLRSSLRDAWLQ